MSVLVMATGDGLTTSQQTDEIAIGADVAAHGANLTQISEIAVGVEVFLHDETLNDVFLAGAKERGLLQLKGHKSVGGMRASIYNAMPIEGVQALIGYLEDFERTHG